MFFVITIYSKRIKRDILRLLHYVIASSRCISKKVDLFKSGRISLNKALYHPEAALKGLGAPVLINSVSLLFTSRRPAMGKGCITVTKYFLFLFNLLFFVSNWVYSSMVMVAVFSCRCMPHTLSHCSVTLSSFIYT